MTCWDPDTKELFHNRAGAFNEALMKYVRPSQALLALKRKNHLSVLDAFFGLGYNTWVLLEELSSDQSVQGMVEITGVDLEPRNVLLFPEVLCDKRLQRVASRIDCTKYGAQHLPQLLTYTFDLTSTLSCSINLHHDDTRILLSKLNDDYDLVFHDPFSPNKVSELWTAEIFAEYFRLLLGNSGRLLTYSSASAVRGGLIEAGFTVYRTMALGGKSGGTLAVVLSRNDNDNERQDDNEYQNEFLTGLDEECIFSLNEEEKQHIRSRSGIPYRSCDLNESRESIWKLRTLEQAAYSKQQAQV